MSAICLQMASALPALRWTYFLLALNVADLGYERKSLLQVSSNTFCCPKSAVLWWQALGWLHINQQSSPGGRGGRADVCPQHWQLHDRSWGPCEFHCTVPACLLCQDIVRQASCFVVAKSLLKAATLLLERYSISLSMKYSHKALRGRGCKLTLLFLLESNFCSFNTTLAVVSFSPSWQSIGWDFVSLLQGCSNVGEARSIALIVKRLVAAGVKADEIGKVSL